jgi:protein-histidine N-methyltransferase
VPSLVLLQLLLIQPASNETPAKGSHFIFADYNAIVLRLVTLPNILLTWNKCCRNRSPDPEGNLEINHIILDAFRRDLSRRGISLSFISGAWSPGFVDLALPETDIYHVIAKSSCRVLILASETIYSPSSLLSFTETLVSLLQRASAWPPQHENIEGRPVSTPRALIAAKWLYFGVGGGVDDFLATLQDATGQVLEVKERADIENEGVGRVILEVGFRMPRGVPASQ